MEQPNGFVEKNKGDMVCPFVLKIGFKRSKHANCVYLRGKISSNSVYLLLYVDNILIASYDKSQIIN